MHRGSVLPIWSHSTADTCTILIHSVCSSAKSFVLYMHKGEKEVKSEEMIIAALCSCLCKTSKLLKYMYLKIAFQLCFPDRKSVV